MDQEGPTPSYTLLLDIFKPARLIAEAQHPKGSVVACNYYYTLEKKGLVGVPGDLVLDSWCNHVFNERDIFVDLRQGNSRAEATSAVLSANKRTLEIQQKLEDLRLEQESQNYKYLDYRFSRVEVIAVDMKQGELFSANEPLKAKLLGYGVVRLYKDHEKEEGEVLKNKGEDTTVAILGVPFYFTASDLLLGFFDKDVPDHVSHMRLLKTETPNRIMVLLKFRAAEFATAFVAKYNGRHFNSMEPEACQAVFVSEVLFRPNNHEDDDPKMSTIPYLLDDPFTKHLHKWQGSAGEGALQELATCPVCLERLDSTVTGLLTIPCQHTFHYSCLSKWDDDSCPVCRYSAKLDLRKRKQEEQEDEKCVECGASENLWICLICGHMGCGRYDSAHAIEHYKETDHCFAMETTTQRVWDYSGDNYVHRLVQNEADGKLVELPLRDESKTGSSGSSGSDNSEENKAKIEKMGLEYSKMLISQLESQREFYDLKFEESQNQLKLANDSLGKVRLTVAQLKKAQEDTASAKELQTQKKLLQEIRKNYEEESTLNEGLSEKVGFLTKQNEQLVKDNAELQDQVRDLMFFLDSQQKFEGASEEVKQGKIVIKQGRKKRH